MITNSSKGTVKVEETQGTLATIEFCSQVCGELALDGCLCGREKLGLIPSGSAQVLIQLAIDEKLKRERMPQQHTNQAENL